MMKTMVPVNSRYMEYRLSYIGIMLGSNIVGYCIFVGGLWLLGKIPQSEVIRNSLPIGWMIIVILSLISFFITGMMIASYTCHNLIIDFESNLSITKIISILFPGEFIRLFITSMPWRPSGFSGYRLCGGILNIIPSFVHDQLYLNPLCRLPDIRENGYTLLDHVTYLFCNFLYFVVYFIFLLFLISSIWKNIVSKKETEIRLTMDPTQIKSEEVMTQHQQVIRRDYYYERSVTWNNRIKYTALTVIGHFGVYMFTIWMSSGLLELWLGTATYVVFEVLLTIPIVIILPLCGMKIYLKNTIPSLYSLADDPKLWYKKAISLLLFGEALRFILGLLPIPMTIFGTVSSPVTMMLYMLFYLNPAGRYDAILVRGEMFFTDIVVFAVIYLGYFILHEWIILCMFRKRLDAHIRYLIGSMEEYNKAQSYYRPTKKFEGL